MADNDHRSYRGREPLAPGGAGRPRVPVNDPLAELARLIGQNDSAGDYSRDERREPVFDDAAPDEGSDWAADDRYAEQSLPASERHDPPRPAAPYPSGPARPSRDLPAPPADDPRYRRDERQLPAFAPRASGARYEYEDAEHGVADDEAYALEDYDEEAGSPRRRGGFVVVAAVLGLAVLGTAGAFAYRAMFGSSMLPTLPPIIKAEDGPTKIMPSYGETHRAAVNQAGSPNANSGEKLVSREEKPVDVPAPVTTAPRVVSTIPILPAPTPGAPGAPPVAPLVASQNILTPVAPTPAAPAPLAPAMPAPAVSSAAPTPPMATPEPKKIHTVPIRPDQSAGTDAAVAPPPPPPARTATARQAIVPVAKPSPAVPAGSAPLEIVPPQGDAAPPAARPRTALARPAQPPAVAASEPAASAGGGYAVQVTSQRSEADAQSAFRALAAKYPDQLGGRAPIVRRADLGDKGVYYRALVGPFASMEQAAGVCSSLKAAGGTCIVQKN